MKKYSVEGGIDFFAELYKSLDDDEPNNKTDEDKNKCLITNQTLTDKFVEMSCGHKFNNIPLYNDVLNHKKKFNNMEGSATRLKHNEMRCPYCRKKQTGLMPYYEELNLPKVSGVNYIDANYDVETDSVPMTSYYKKCEFLTPNVCFNVNSQNVIEVYKQNLVLEEPVVSELEVVLEKPVLEEPIVEDNVLSEETTVLEAEPVLEEPIVEENVLSEEENVREAILSEANVSEANVSEVKEQTKPKRGRKKKVV